MLTKEWPLGIKVKKIKTRGENLRSSLEAAHYKEIDRIIISAKSLKK